MSVNLKMAESESEEAVRLRDKASEMLKSTSSIALPTSKEQKSSYFVTKSLAEMVNEDPIRLQNRSCGIRKEIVKTQTREKLVYSSLARLPTFSIGLSSTKGEGPPRAPLHESSVGPEDKSPHRYFQMPKLGARVLVGDGDGFDTVSCHFFYQHYHASEIELDSEYTIVRSLYKNDRPGGLSGWLRAQPVEFWRSEASSEVILSGTQLFVGPPGRHAFVVGNLGGKSSRVSGSSSDDKDCTGDETIGQPSDIVEQPENPVPGVHHFGAGLWETVEGPDLFRFTKGLYLEKPKFMKTDDRGFLFDRSRGDVLQLTRFDDFVIFGNKTFNHSLPPYKVIDIVQKNASKTADVIAAQLVKGVIQNSRSFFPPGPITAIVIFLDHEEIWRREHGKEKKENMAKNNNAISLELKGISQSTLLTDEEMIAELKEEEKITTLKEGEKIFASEKEDQKGIIMEADYKVKILVDELLPNVPQTSTVSLEENELGMKSRVGNSNPASVEVQDDFEASSSVVLTEDDDCKSKGFEVSLHLTKWIIYGDLLQRTLLCFFNMEEMQYEFYFEDHESMATMIGLGVPHSKVVLECGSPHVTVVEIPQEDWDDVWTHSYVIPPSIPEGDVLKQERFPTILHRIANIINSDNIVSKANNGGVGGDNRKGKAQDNVDERKGKGKADDHDDRGNIGHPDGGYDRAPDDNDNNERKGKDGTDNKEGRDRDDGKTSYDCKEIQVVVHLRLLPGGVLEEKKKKKELGEGRRGVEKKKKKNLKGLLYALKLGENGNVGANQQKLTTIEGVDNGDIDENLQKQLENQIHAQMVFTFMIKDEAGERLKTIQATIDPITFQFPSNNEENYLQRRRFGWFHEKLKVAFGVVNTQVADLDAKSCKVLDSSEAKEVNLQGNSKSNARTSSNAYKGEMGIKYGFYATGAYGRTNGLETKTSEDIQNSWETHQTLTKGGFSISEHTNLNSHQLKYSYLPHFPFNEKEFEGKDEGDRLNMYDLNPICQLQRVSCEGSWQPDHSEKLEAYKLEASRELGMTRIYNLEFETREEKKRKRVWRVEKNLPPCFIQTLEKVVYLNHAMSHLTSSTIGVYRLKERRDSSDPSTTSLTLAQRKEKPKWPSNDPFVDVKQQRNF